MRINNYSSPNSTGRVDTLYSPVVNLSGLAASQLRFDVAYAQYTGKADTLTILAAANCGTNYQVVYRKGGTALATASARTSSFTPTSSEWRTETINLSAFSGASSVQFVFVSRSAYGNYIYMDNINMVTSGVQPIACSFTYSPWTTCNGTQTRTFSASPAGCVGVPPADSLTRTCSVQQPNQNCTTTLRNIVKPTNAVTAIGTTSPANENVAKAIDNNVNTKYLNFQGANSGLTINTDTLAIVRGLVLVSANDVPTRDPSSYQLSGSLDGVSYTLISQGSFALFTARFQAQEIAFSNSTAYRHYRLIFPTIVGASCANCSVMQVAEVRLLACAPPTVNVSQPCTALADVTLTGDVVEIVNGSNADSRNPPIGEEPIRAIDNQPAKYLNFTGFGSGFVVTVPRAHNPVVQLSITSGNDAPERDPASYRLQGWDGFKWLSIAEGDVPLFTARRQRVVLSVFANTKSYTRYRVTFPTLRGTSFMQVSEVELLGCAPETLFNGALAIGNELVSKPSFTIFPNPGIGLFTLKTSGLDKLAEIQVYNMVGQLVKTQVVQSSITESTLDLSDFPAGTYLIKFKTDNLNKSLRLIKQ